MINDYAHQMHDAWQAGVQQFLVWPDWPFFQVGGGALYQKPLRWTKSRVSAIY
jgi:hypothetical protein